MGGVRRGWGDVGGTGVCEGLRRGLGGIRWGEGSTLGGTLGWNVREEGHFLENYYILTYSFRSSFAESCKS